MLLRLKHLAGVHPRSALDLRGVGWIVVTYKLSAEASRARVAVWRETRRSGATHLQQSVVAFPDTNAFRAAIKRLRALVDRADGPYIGGPARCAKSKRGEARQLAASRSRVHEPPALI